MKKICLAFLVCLGVASCAMAEGVGTDNGRLRPCPGSPNCVVSEGSDANILPFFLTSQEGWERLRQAVIAQGGNIEREDDGYLHATFKSRLFGFVDDLECRRDGTMAQVRSASKVGWWDLGANRRRVERLRRALLAGEK
jgi:uncharacterized protein (DUF1499 family)